MASWEPERSALKEVVTYVLYDSMYVRCPVKTVYRESRLVKVEGGEVGA